MPQYERFIRWDDPKLSIDWKLNSIKPTMSLKDQEGVLIIDSEIFN